VLAYQGRLLVLDQLVNPSGDALAIGLYTNSVEPTLTSVFADIVQASYNGYAPQTADFDAANLNGDNDAESNLVTPLTFIQTGISAPQTVYGAFCFKPVAGGILLNWLHFPAPIIFIAPGSFVIIPTWRSRIGALLV